MTETNKASKLTKREALTLKFNFYWRLHADKTLSFAAKSVAVSLIFDFHNDETDLCNPGFDGLAESAGCGRRTAIRAIAELKNAGWITVESTHGGSSRCTNRYSLDFELTAAPAQGVKASANVGTRSGKASAKSVKASANVGTRTTYNHPAFGRGVGEEDPGQRAPDGALEEFEELRQLWQRPYGMNVAKALAAFNRIIGDGDVAPAGILESARRWVAATEPDRLQALERWLDDGAWRNNPPARRNSSNRKRSAAEVAAGLARAAAEGGGW